VCAVGSRPHTRGAALADPAAALLAMACRLVSAGVGSRFGRLLHVLGLLEVRRTGRKWEPPRGAIRKHGLAAAEMAATIASGGTLAVAVQGDRIVWDALPGVQQWSGGILRERAWRERGLASLATDELTALLPAARRGPCAP
jgi:hypothetical protein